MNRPPAKLEFSRTRYGTDAVAEAKQAAAAVNLSLQSDDNAEREFEFNDKDFSRVRALILKIAGISLAPSKQSMVYSRLARRLRACKHNRFSSYLDALEHNSSNPEWEHFTNSLTTNLTSFYREAHHFEILKKQLQSMSRNSRIELWCSAASTGEEPYTMAITAMEAFNSMNPPVRILATDIDTKVLEHARKGVYRMDQVEKIPEDILRKYFIKGKGESDGLICVRPEVQALVTFKKLNLMESAWSLRPGFDAIFCRNVMIYFEKDVQLQILKRFAPLLNTNGLLYAGHSENFAMARDYFSLRGKTVYTVNADKAAKTGADGEGLVRKFSA
ncbi:MAG: chemotaxis protein CheR [Gammaproteobacteria bacterium]|nr:chemotaxis protein CheR [Gammaproteobacteria bacterium]MBU0848243.1 chemotaxis protein CheR [Gammaproteobacteria bacterium]MBU1266937.1 chemotaxis protein CheR [Gammaproteobacteria bacterium]MBU1528450.1 chemotaxis protein CheR [Gammaproteobacteria bacterium]MBU1779139.1 chemotaxis protein CheR [Gammaproteobacteria bacterium]